MIKSAQLIVTATSKGKKPRAPTLVRGGLGVAARDGNKVHARLPLRTTTESNAKGSWRPKAERAKIQRTYARDVVRTQLPRVPCTIEMVRIAPVALDDDNLPSALKHVRDGIADALGLDDRDKRLKFTCSEKSRGRGDYAVEVTITEAPDAVLLPLLLPKTRKASTGKIRGRGARGGWVVPKRRTTP